MHRSHTYINYVKNIPINVLNKWAVHVAVDTCHTVEKHIQQFIRIT